MRIFPLDIRVIVLLICLSVAAAAACGTAAAQGGEDSRTFVAAGAAPITGSNVAAARQNAIANGLMEAVVLAAMEVLTTERFVENFKVLSERLLERPEDFIQDYKVLTEASSGRQHRVVLQATVAVRKIGNLIADAALLPARPAAESSPVTLSIEGSGNLANFVKFRRALGGTAGVESIQVREMKPNETTLLVVYRGKAAELAAALSQQTYEGFEVRTIETSDAGLRVAIVPR
jgi:hypothetical protein